MISTGVYAVVCLISNEAYIGSTKDSFSRRWRMHRADLARRRHVNPRFQRTWDKYGETSFDFRVLERVAADDDLLAREQYWIDNAVVFCSFQGLLNIAPIAGSTAGIPKSPEWRQKIAELARQQWRNPVHRDFMAGVNRGRIHGADARERMAAAKRGRRLPEATREKLRASQTRANADPERRRRSAEIMRSAWADPEQRRQRSEAIKRTMATDEARTRRSAASARSYRGFVGPDGVVYRNVTNLERWCAEHRLDGSTMGKVAHGQRRQYKGWRALRDDDDVSP